MPSPSMTALYQLSAPSEPPAQVRPLIVLKGMLPHAAAFSDHLSEASCFCSKPLALPRICTMAKTVHYHA